MTADELLKKYQLDVLAKTPYRMNLVELLHANENAHTRILVNLLRYNHNDSDFEFAKSFVRRFVPGIECKAVPQVCEQLEYIDALIGVPGEYAIVVENKINWAVDQDKQIERYLDAAEANFEIHDKKNLYAIYLTDNGEKTPSEISLTQRAKEILDVVDDHWGRLIELNYRDDIVPWIVEDVLPCCRHGDTTTITALEQYVDYLKNRLENKPEFDVREAKLLDLICAGSPTYRDCYKKLKSFEILLKEDSVKKPSDASAIDRTNLIELIERKERALCRADYSLDEQMTISQIVLRLREFANSFKYHGPKTYQTITIIFSEVCGADKSRMKFQLTVNNDRHIAVGFFDNAASVILNERYPRLVQVFKNTFDGAYFREEGGHNLWADTTPLNNEEDLNTFLNLKVDPFMKQFMKDVVM